MGFLIRIGFWFSLVLLMLPLGPQGEAGSVGAFQAFLAAREALSDLGGMCERRPEVCRTGKDAMLTIGARAQEGANLALGMLAADGAERDPTATTGSILAAE
ncbi:MAG: hypothetical protein K0S21_423 [Rhizobiaceae bacterium]|jgi:hypothetical protein|nr:hypothetical protein [Rhizobiaceae bacterium]